MKSETCGFNHILKPPFIDDFSVEFFWNDEVPDESTFDIVCNFKAHVEERLGVIHNVEAVSLKDLIDEIISKGHDLDMCLKHLESMSERVRSAMNTSSNG